MVVSGVMNFKPDSSISAVPLVVYGTLQNETVQNVLLGDAVEKIPVSIMNVAAKVVKGKYFPGLVHQPGSQTAGFLLPSITFNQLKIINAFEDTRYVLHPVTFRHKTAPKTLEHGLCYMWEGDVKDLGEKWDYGVWEETWSEAYIERTKEWKKAYDVHSEHHD